VCLCGSHGSGPDSLLGEHRVMPMLNERLPLFPDMSQSCHEINQRLATSQRRTGRDRASNACDAMEAMPASSPTRSQASGWTRGYWYAALPIRT
jgi:hypothetical protein